MKKAGSGYQVIPQEKTRSLLELIFAQPKQKGGARARALLWDIQCWSVQCHGTHRDSKMSWWHSQDVELSVLVISYLFAEFPAPTGVNPVLREGGKPRCISCSEESQQTQQINALKHRNSVHSINSRRGLFRPGSRVLILWNWCCNVYNHKRGERDKKDF